MSLNKTIFYLLWLTAFLTPIFWVARGAMLIVLVPIAFLLCLIKAFREKEFIIKRTPLDYFLFAYIAIGFLAAYFSLNRYASLWAWATTVALILFYWLSASLLNKNKIRKLLGALISSGFIACIWFILGAIKELPITNNLLGSLSVLSSFSACLLILSFYFLWTSKSKKIKLLNIISGILFLLIIALINFKIGWIALIVGAIVSLVVLTARKTKAKAAIAWPLIILIIGLFWSFLSLGPIYNLTLPIEVSLGRTASFNIAKDAVHSGFKPLVLGTGQGTWQYNFSQFRTQEFNQNSLWQIRFSQANNQLSETWATTGYLGLLSLLSLIILGLILGIKSRLLLPVLLAILAVSWFSPLSISLWLLFFLLLLAIVPKSNKGQLKLKLAKTGSKGLATSFILIIGVVLAVLFFGSLAKVYLADYYYLKGDIQQAIKYNPRQAIYYLALAQESMRDAIEISAQEEVDQTALGAKVAIAINSSQRAIELSPNNVALWQARSEIFKQSRRFTADANQWVISTLNRAIELEPTNPVFYQDLGVAYEIQENNDLALSNYNQAVELKPNLTTAQYELGRFLYNQDDIDGAIEHLEQAVIVSPNYANALYSLSLAYEKNDRKDEALILMQRVLELNPENQEVQNRVDKLSPKKEVEVQEEVEE